MCGSMVDIQSPTAENRRGKKKKKRRKKIETARQKYNGLPYSIGGHKKTANINVKKTVVL